MKNLHNPSISRREFLQMAMVMGTGFIASCGKLATLSPSPIAQTSGAPLVTPGVTLTPPAYTPTKIDTVIILLQENHSFDSLFATFPGASGKPAPNVCPNTIKRDIPEGGLTVSYYCSYTEEQIPNYWELARNFTLCDQYFSEVRGPSFPNYSMLTTAQSTIMSNPRPPYECPHYCVDVNALANRLDDRGLTWHDYGGLLANIKSLSGRPEISYKSMDGFFQDAAAGTLQNVIWIGAYLVGGIKDSGHPPSNICDAENFAVSIINAAMGSPQWSSILVFLIWDEWGGFYDHVIPPVIERLPNGKPVRYGFRVPCLVISPYAQPGYIAHAQYSHVSILKTIEMIFDLEPLTERDADAYTMLDCLNFSQPPMGPILLSPRICTS